MDALEVVVDGQNRRIPLSHGLTLSQQLFVAGLWTDRPLCSGLGRCGLCRVRFLSGTPEPSRAEARLLAEREIASGVRLACRHQARAGMRLEVVDGARVAEPREEPSGSGQPGTRAAALAVDLGTTSIHWSAGAASGVLANPQLGAGSEVLSRLALARQGHAPELARAVRGALQKIVDRITPVGGRPQDMCIAANTAMTYLLLGFDVQGLSVAPYRLDFRGASWQTPEARWGRCYIPPLLGPFVGGDASAGIVSIVLGAQPARYPFLLADLGTNGEFVLALSPTEFLVTSVPMGPALEGIGLSRGMLAGPGAITSVGISPQGLEAGAFPGTGEVRGLSGTGYLELLAALRSIGVLDERGGFVTPETPLGRTVARGLVRDVGETRLELPTLGPDIFLAASDVEEVLKVKAAFATALDSLAASSGGWRQIFLAGALGEHLRPEILERLGFLPPGAAAWAAPAGNTALAGARMLVKDGAAREWAERLFERSTLVDVTQEAGFETRFLERMTFRHV